MATESASLALNTYQSLVSTFCEFFLVAVHSVIYEREIYPRNTFLSARKYNCAVRQSRHPKVCQWIINAVTAVETELLKGSVEKATLLIISLDSQPLERYVFDLSRFPAIPPAEIATEFESQPISGSSAPLVDVVSVVDLEEQLRAVLRKLSSSAARLGRLPAGCTYTITVELSDSSDPPVGHPQPWIPSQLSLQRYGRGQEKRLGEDLSGNVMIPIRSVEAGEFIFECWAEEFVGKSKKPRSVTKNTSNGS